MVVTGTASGIGGATARLLTEEGAVVVGVDRDPVDAGLGARGAAVPAMFGGGGLVHVGSYSARLPEIGTMAYAAAKLSLLAASASLATNFSPQGIRSNVPTTTPSRWT
ncbi:SDR family oxidoreductase [Streptomyces mirabilis]|uniref:SDR family oxidoreductase n=1 Tax=Streptomyces mirabilis TaxID=68239 RepID=UPI0009429BA8|nr:SDR family oxidoreductase [Streptomyces mirabilis]